MIKIKISYFILIFICLCVFYIFYNTPLYQFRNRSQYDVYLLNNYNTGNDNEYIPKDWTGVPISYSNKLFINYKDNNYNDYEELINIIQSHDNDYLKDSIFWEKTTLIYEELIGWNGIFDAINESGFDSRGIFHTLGEIFYSHYPNEDYRYLVEICSRDVLHESPLHGLIWSIMIDNIYNNETNLLELYDDICYYKYYSNLGTVWVSCVHGIGHALTRFYDDNIPSALQACSIHDDPQFQYSCASGVYMDLGGYSNSFFPCDIYLYPSTCFRFRSEVYANLQKNNTVDPCYYQADNYHNIGCIYGYAFTFNKIESKKAYFSTCEQYLPKTSSQQYDIALMQHAACIDGFFTTKPIKETSKDYSDYCVDLLDYPLSYHICIYYKTTNFKNFTFYDKSTIYFNTPLLEYYRVNHEK